MLSDTLRVADLLRKAGSKLRVSVYDGMFHVFQMAYRLIPESREAWEEVSVFLRIIYGLRRKVTGKTVRRVKSGRDITQGKEKRHLRNTE